MVNRSSVITIIRKEFARFFGDRSMVFTAVVMPGLLIYLVYTLMGNGMTRENFISSSDVPPTVYVDRLPESLLPFVDSVNMRWVPMDIPTADIIALIDDKECNAVFLSFPPAFDSLCATYCPSDGMLPPSVRIYYNSSNDGSTDAYQRLVAILQSYEDGFCNRFDINRYDDLTDGGFDRIDDDAMMSSVLSKLIPMLLLMLLFSGCMAVAPTSIAGEKERGTIATLLVTPMRRSELAAGKIISLSCFVLLSALSSFLGIMLSLPKILQGGQPDGEAVTDALFSTSDVLLLLLILLTTGLLLVAVVANLSTLAKDVKQASTINIPLSLLMIVVGMLPMFMPESSNSVFPYLIPFYNSVISMTEIISHNAHIVPLLVTVGSNVVYVVGCGWLLTRLMGSERVMFGK